MPIMNHPVRLADFEEFELNPHSREILSRAEPKEEQGGNFKFVAPSFAAMMLDFQKLEATLRAIEAGCEFVPPGEDTGDDDESGEPSAGLERTSAITLDEFRQIEFERFTLDGGVQSEVDLALDPVACDQQGNGRGMVAGGPELKAERKPGGARLCVAGAEIGCL